MLSRTGTEQVWDMNFDSNTNVVEVSIKRLRAKMDTPFEMPLPYAVWVMSLNCANETGKDD